MVKRVVDKDIKLPPDAASYLHHHDKSIFVQCVLNMPLLFKFYNEKHSESSTLLIFITYTYKHNIPNNEPSGLQITRLTETPGSLTRAACKRFIRINEFSDITVAKALLQTIIPK